MSYWSALALALAICFVNKAHAQPAPAVAPNETPVQLPAFLVEEGKNTWYTAKAPGLEVLSLLPPDETRELVEAFLEARNTFDRLVPPAFQGRSRDALTIILWDRSRKDTVPAETIAQYWPQDDSSGFRIERLPNLLVTDLGACILFCTPPTSSISRGDHMRLTPQMVEYLLKTRQPALPRGMVPAFTKIYGDARSTDKSLQLHSVPWNWKLDRGENGFPLLAKLLDEKTTVTSETSERWQSAWQIFVLWSLDPRFPERTSNFWHFMERCSAGEDSRTAFRICYGTDCANLDDDLSRFLRKARRDDFASELDLSGIAPPVEIEVEKAGWREVIRIKGNWLRLAAGCIKPDPGPLRSAYLDEARKTVRNYLEKNGGDRDLLRLAGLIEADAGNAAAAEVLLNQAFSAGAADALLGVTLSRLRMDRLGVATDATSLSELLQPLVRCCENEIPPVEAVQLAVTIMGSAKVPPSLDELQQLARWAHFFPRRPTLLFAAAQILLHHDCKKEADELTRFALNNPLRPEGRQELEALLRRSNL